MNEITKSIRKRRRPVKDSAGPLYQLPLWCRRSTFPMIVMAVVVTLQLQVEVVQYIHSFLISTTLPTHQVIHVPSTGKRHLRAPLSFLRRNNDNTSPIQTMLSDTHPSRRPSSDKNTPHPKRVTKHPIKKTASMKSSSSSSTKATTTLKHQGELQSWRVYGVEVHPDRLVDVNNTSDHDTETSIPSSSSSSQSMIHPAILEALRIRLNLPTTAISKVPIFTLLDSVQIVRRSVDARLRQQRSDQSFGPRYIYVMDITMTTSTLKQYQIRPFKPQSGRMEEISSTVTDAATNVVPTTVLAASSSSATTTTTTTTAAAKKPCVIIVGAGPAGLFCALQLAKSGCVTPIVLERGQPVETRGKDIGALIHRKALNTESNFAFGEGGAGTWSDGKLTTRIGRNSDMVRKVLETFVQYGAPSNILVEGAPHLGTDNLVRLLRNMRKDLRRMGGIVKFGTKVTGLIIENNVTTGVKYEVSRESTERNIEPVGNTFINDESSESGILFGDSVVLATGHSARDVYEQLHDVGVSLEAKGFAVGFRVEHPQKLINNIQYGQEWGPSVITGKGTTDTANANYFSTLIRNDTSTTTHHSGKLPVPSYRLATDKASDGKLLRGVYSFCMCPGGQIVPASTETNEVCVNGMSFSRRDSPFANSALVVTVDPNDEILEPYRSEHGVLAGIAFQRDMERRAAIMGGGNFVVPVQRVTDFLSNTESTTAPPSSYRLGVKPAACHLIYPEPLVISMKHALVEQFNRQMPGFICDDGLLHGVETRTSSPVRVIRDGATFQAIGTKNLFPAGEGAGFAGGIVSAAVDGIAVADAILREKFDFNTGIESRHAGTKIVMTY